METYHLSMEICETINTTDCIKVVFFLFHKKITKFNKHSYNTTKIAPIVFTISAILDFYLILFNFSKKTLHILLVIAVLSGYILPKHGMLIL